jgi:hypothetical protein
MSKTNVRESTFISQKKTHQIYKAFDFAERIGTPLNYYVVLHLQDTVEQASGTAFRKILSKFRDWHWNKYRILRYNYSPPLSYVYTHENPNNNPHVNWVVHIPEGWEIEFQEKLIGWVTKVQGKPNSVQLQCKPVDMTNYKSLASYIVKGCDPEHAERFFLDTKEWYHEKAYQGVIYGQRAGFSRALGPTAQKKLSFNAREYRRSKGYSAVL